METSKILTADWLDILFDNRNKDYGAYELRKTYQKRIGKALLTTTLAAALIIGGTVLASSVKNATNRLKISEGIVIADLPDTKPPEKLPEPEKIKAPEQVKTKIFTEPKIVPPEEFDKPMPDQDDLDSAKFGDKNIDGPAFTGIAGPPENPGGDKGVIETKEVKDEGPVTFVEVQAKFIGDWRKFLLKNLDPDVPARNNAPAGRHTVMIQFVVDKEGNVSDIKALTHVGYGMEEEAIRVIRKASQWEPAIQNGYKVKAYRQQPITFEVLGDE